MKAAPDRGGGEIVQIVRAAHQPGIDMLSPHRGKSAAAAADEPGPDAGEGKLPEHAVQRLDRIGAGIGNMKDVGGFAAVGPGEITFEFREMDTIGPLLPAAQGNTRDHTGSSGQQQDRQRRHRARIAPARQLQRHRRDKQCDGRTAQPHRALAPRKGAGDRGGQAACLAPQMGRQARNRLAETIAGQQSRHCQRSQPGPAVQQQR